MADTYHHGDLRRAVLDRALQVIAGAGPEHLSLRGIAQDLGVSHTAPRHHFGSRDGVLTAIAIEGFDALSDALDTTSSRGGSLLDLGVAYVEFAVSHPAHFAVMFRPDLLLEDPELTRAGERAFSKLRGGVESLGEGATAADERAAVVAGWSLVHGLSTLALTGSLARAKVAPESPEELADLARRAAAMLYSGR
ncbi:TetR/AcrR family transcriptional regulator [Tessaracoccus sp. OS52]|uniref:TetR/AcrR family transcriptional regulator n=1 Tax=Tessaracoccus sp. OS52 TaxID=2886691 RepID=UPI001D0FF360|nr:TetR/AcrR family transcriptional regulator [Tessaracoccus sp. OS52]MCC2592679.1 TetR/AcrR family transcriptional regulator [Tessaracoccus sp. OS52]